MAHEAKNSLSTLPESPRRTSSANEWSPQITANSAGRAAHLAEADNMLSFSRCSSCHSTPIRSAPPPPPLLLLCLVSGLSTNGCDRFGGSQVTMESPMQVRQSTVGDCQPACYYFFFKGILWPWAKVACQIGDLVESDKEWLLFSGGKCSTVSRNAQRRNCPLPASSNAATVIPQKKKNKTTEEDRARA